MKSEFLNNCLAYNILADMTPWFGTESLKCLESFLAGVHSRAMLTESEIETWRIFGPLEQREFYEPLVALTGHPQLTIRWSTALELYHFSLPSAVNHLKDLVENWFVNDLVNIESKITVIKQTEDEFWKQLSQRPAMFIGSESSWLLYCFLKGMNEGGDWLNLPDLNKPREMLEKLEERSKKSYGSTFGGFRVYENSIHELLKWADV